MKRSEIARILLAATQRGDIPRATMHRFPPRQLGDIDPHHIYDLDEADSTLRIWVWSSQPQPELARAYADAVSRHLPGGWMLAVYALAGRPVVEQQARVWHGPAIGPPAPLPPLQPVVTASQP